MSDPAWQILAGLPAWQVTQIPRAVPPRGDTAGGDDTDGRRPPSPAEAERGKRMMVLGSAARSGSAAAFGWVRASDSGPVRVIAAGKGLSSRADGTPPPPSDEAVPLGYPAGALGRPLENGELTSAFGELPFWKPVAVTPDALLSEINPAGLSLEDGLLQSWRQPFGWLVLAAPAGRERHAELLSEASLAQLQAERHDSPRAKLSARRWQARHDELRQASVSGLWDIWLLAGGATPDGASRVAGFLCSSLDLEKLPFGLTELDQCGTLPEILGARAVTAGTVASPQREPGPLAREVLGMQGGQASEPFTLTTPEPPQPAPSRWTPGAQPPPSPPPSSSPRQQVDSNGFPVWAPPPPDPGWGPGGPGGTQPGTFTAGGQQSATSATAPGGLAPEFPDPEPQFPCAASSRLLAALAVPPAQEIPGIRMVLKSGFDVTPETGEDDGAVGLGTVLDASRVGSSALNVSRSSLNRHTFVCGATGAGKSQTVRHLLESASAAGIPWLVIEPAKAEYRLMAARLPGAEVVTIRPGDLNDVPAGINPLEPAAGPDGTRFQLQAHADLVRALFLAAFQADEPFPQVLAAALQRCYSEAGWDMLTGEPAVAGASYPALGDLQAAALKVVDEIGYSREITDNVRGFVSVRIGSLMGGTTGRFLNGGFPLDYERLLAGNVVLEIEDCGDDTDKAFLTGAVLIRLTEHLRMRARQEGPGSPGLRHLTVVEEAHRLLRQPPEGASAGAAAHAVEMFAGLLAEIRAYGEGLVIAEQIPSKLIPDVIKNTAVKVVHRLPAKDDREAVGATMNLTEEQSRYLVTLRPGEAAVFLDGMDYPVLAKMPDGSERETGTEIRSGKIGGLVSGRSPACPPDCRAAACALGQIAAAQRALERDRLIAMWAEVTVAAHVAGWPSPGPGDRLAARLADLDPRTRDCVLARAVDDAVAARIPAISSVIAGPALAGHVAEAMRGILDHGRKSCDGEAAWTVPVAGDGGAAAGEPGLSRVPSRRDVVFGIRRPSAFEKATTTWARSADFTGQLTRLLSSLPYGDAYAKSIADAAGRR